MEGPRHPGIYLDNNATTPPLPTVVDAVTAALQSAYGNPSSAHSAGDAARRLLADTRDELAALLGGEADQFLLTSGGTEANNLALNSLVGAGARRLVATAVEHSSVLQHAHRLSAEGVDVVVVPPTADGRVDPQSIERAISGAACTAVSVQWVNNETGVIQPVEQIARAVRNAGAMLHIDGAQALGKLPMSIRLLDPDFLSVTAHKINGPAGIGALYVRNSSLVRPIRFGGSQQRGLHPGTENIAGAAGFAAALRARRYALHSSIEHMEVLRDAFESTVLQGCPWARLNGSRTSRVCNTTNIRFAGVDGQALLARLDGAGVYCSQSSACTNQRPEPSSVLRAMGLSETEAYESVRFSTGVLNTEAEVLEAAAVVVDTANALKRLFS